MNLMRIKKITMVVAAGSLGLAACALGLAAAPASGKVAAPSATKVTVINVTIGQPTERSFRLSKVSGIPVGRVVFKVTNKGRAIHDFKVCTAAVASAKAISCQGTGTKRLSAGATATLAVTFKKAGAYQFLSTLPGNARGGMKGLLRVGLKASAPPTAGTPITITAAGRTITARLNNTAVARDFLAMLPITLSWTRAFGIEYGTELESPLTETGPFYTNVQPGDIVYYNPLDSVTIIYAPASSVPTLTKMGEITSDLSVFRSLPANVSMQITAG